MKFKKIIHTSNWFLLLTGSLIAIISFFTPVIYFINHDAFKFLYIFGLTITVNDEFIFYIEPLYVSLVSIILLFFSTIKLIILSNKIRKRKPFDSIDIIIYSTLLIASPISFFLIFTLSSSAISGSGGIVTIWNYAIPYFGLIGPFIGFFLIIIAYILMIKFKTE